MARRGDVIERRGGGASRGDARAATWIGGMPTEEEREPEGTYEMGNGLSTDIPIVASSFVRSFVRSICSRSSSFSKAPAIT